MCIQSLSVSFCARRLCLRNKKGTVSVVPAALSTKKSATNKVSKRPVGALVYQAITLSAIKMIVSNQIAPTRKKIFLFCFESNLIPSFQMIKFEYSAMFA